MRTKSLLSGVPAILGGAVALPQGAAFVRPALPPFESLEVSVREMFGNGQLTKGRHLDRFEQAVADHLSVKHAIAVSSCTSGLMLTYQGLGLEGEVVAPSFTFMATVSALVWAGLRPVFADVCPHRATLDLAATERAITPRTSAIVAVHTFGNPAEIDALQALADRHGLALVFDAAHGFGARYQGKPVGAQGDAQVFSLSPTKLLVAGEGGIVATNDDALARRVRLAREYGNDGSYDSLLAGMNARMPEFNALLGYHSLPLLEEVAVRRNQAASIYHEQLGVVPGIKFQRIDAGNRCSYKDFSIAIDAGEFGLSRDHLVSALAAEGIQTRNYYSPAVHQQTAYLHFAARDADLTNTTLLAEQSLSLPMGTHLCDDTVIRICQAVDNIHRYAPQIRSVLAAQSANAA